MITIMKKLRSTSIIGVISWIISVNLTFGQTFPVGHMSINFKDAARTGGYVISGGINVTGSGRDVGTEVYYPATVAGDNNPVASGQFPVVIIGHGFVMSWDSYDNIYNQLASTGYIVLLPRTEGGFSPSHAEFGNDLRFLVGAAQSLNSITTPSQLTTFNGKVLSPTAIGGHSMGGGSSFLASESNTSITCIFNFAPATTNPSSITSASLVTVPALIISGASDCVADTTVQNSHYAALASSIKFHIILSQLTHCDFGNGTNFNCTFGQNSSGCSNVVSNAAALPRYMNYVQNFLDNQLKGDCGAGQRFMDSVNAVSSWRAGLKKQGSIACSASLQQASKNLELSIYPNPTNSKINIDLSMTETRVRLYDLYGKLLLDDVYKNGKKSIELNIEEFIAGTYIIEVESEGDVRRGRVIKR